MLYRKKYISIRSNLVCSENQLNIVTEPFKNVSIDKQRSTDKRYVEPLEKCDLGIGSTISSDTYQQLSSPVLLIQIGRSIGSESTGGGKYYRIALS